MPKAAEPLPDTPALLAADQADNRIRLFNPFLKTDLWIFPTPDAPEHTHKPTDAKRVPFAGATHILAAYHGRVQLIRYADHHLVKDFPSLPSCHSAEILPDGNLVTANSNHATLRLHRSATEFEDHELPYAHGLTWDKERECLWALGDKLYQLTYRDATLAPGKEFPLPLDPTGHDLFPLRSEAKLLVSNNKALSLFDIATSKFEPVSEIEGIKSASQHIDGTLWSTFPADKEGFATWQTDTVTRVRPKDPAKNHRNDGSKFYKARWWQEVTFSYD